jgi:alpha-glucosidase (family GH31 glycosyl hydrolase)
VDDEYLFGPDLLVAPMTGPGDVRNVHLPSGKWVDFWTGATITGGQQIESSAPINRIPVFVRHRSEIPLQLSPTLALGDSMTAGRVRALLVAGTEDRAKGFSAHSGVSAIILIGNGQRQVLKIAK